MTCSSPKVPRRGPEMRPGIVELFDLAFLPLKHGVVHASAIDARRRTCLEARNLETDARKLLCEMRRRGLSGATARHFGVRPDVNSPTEKGSGRYDDRLGAESPSFERLDTEDHVVVQD